MRVDAPSSGISLRPASVLDSIAVRDPERAQLLKDVQGQLKQTLSSMRSSKTNINEQAKAVARDKIARLKEQIKTLRMMAGSDPKMIAQQVARLAKELAAAVKDYTSAGGTDMAIPTNNTMTSSTQTTPDTDNPEQSVLEDVPEIKESEPEPVNDVEVKNQNISTTKQADIEFATSVKKLVDELKIIIKQQVAKLRHNDHSDTKKNLHEGEDVLQDIEKSLQSMMMPSYQAVDLQA